VDGIPDWSRAARVLVAFSRGCAARDSTPKGSCAAAAPWWPPRANARSRAFTATDRTSRPTRQTTAGVVTGYYEPLLRGSRTRTPAYRYPIYAVPQDLVVIDLATVYPDLKHKRLRGRLDGNRVVPYYARGDIDRDDTQLKGLEIAWVDDPIELFFLHIRGSGRCDSRTARTARGLRTRTGILSAPWRGSSSRSANCRRSARRSRA
jgi:membrane-bound lytic murein transglycosylase A